MDVLILEFLSPLALNNREDGRDIFKLWKSFLPELLVDYYGNCEPINRIFDQNNLEIALECFGVRLPVLA